MAGYVSELYSNTCEITTVIDVEMQCGALITRTRETAIAEGDYDLMADGNLRLSYLTETQASLSAIQSRPQGAAVCSPRVL